MHDKYSTGRLSDDMINIHEIGDKHDIYSFYVNINKVLNRDDINPAPTK